MEKQYVVYGDFAAPYGWCVDTHVLNARPWWKKLLGIVKDAIVAGGTREEMQKLADKMNKA